MSWRTDTCHEGKREVIYLIVLRSNVGWIGLTSFSGRSGVTWAIRHSLFMGSRWVMCIKLVLYTSFAAPLSQKRGCCMYVYARIKNSINGPKTRIIINKNVVVFRRKTKFICCMPVHRANPSGRAVLRRGSAAARLLGLWVRILPGSWTSVSFECCVLTGRVFTEYDKYISTVASTKWVTRCI